MEIDGPENRRQNKKGEMIISYPLSHVLIFHYYEITMTTSHFLHLCREKELAKVTIKKEDVELIVRILYFNLASQMHII